MSGRPRDNAPNGSLFICCGEGRPKRALQDIQLVVGKIRNVQHVRRLDLDGAGVFDRRLVDPTRGAPAAVTQGKAHKAGIAGGAFGEGDCALFPEEKGQRPTVFYGLPKLIVLALPGEYGSRPNSACCGGGFNA